MGRFSVGQRWISEAEPELGLGTVMLVEEGRVRVSFPGTGEDRQYSVEGAPLRRVRFAPGTQVMGRDGNRRTVTAVESMGDLLVYRDADGGVLPETALCDSLSFGSPVERLMQGRTDPSRVYELRRLATELQHRRRESPVRGFVGGRIDLIPHQLYIAGEVTGRQAPRVLLADEVGLGKTIEACLVIHRLLATGRVGRVLVVVPESLVHQWFVELLRRFNLWFHIFDEDRCDAIETAHPEGNPFLDDQLVLCGLPLLLNAKRGAQAVEAEWDLLVVDEAHHLQWSAEAPSPAYQVVEALGRRAEGLLLLTATPEQLGLESHFARLRLLDPHRYYDLEAFKMESAGYQAVAAVVNRLAGKESVGPAELGELRRILGPEPGPVQHRLEALAGGDEHARDEVVSALLDRHGTGRVVFRNRRTSMKGFPMRIPRPVVLEAESLDDPLLERLATEFQRDMEEGSGGAAEVGSYDDARDPRVMWLVEFLRKKREVKVLLICRSKAKVLALDAALRVNLNVSVALFHEDLELVQRDRQAAWFADPEGAPILLASEIGSEGRNFQFAHHLVLFDLPLDPELLEQRIGRLDRIGQTAHVEIHIPYVLNSPQEVVFRWFHEGLDAFERHLHGGRALLEEFRAEVLDMAQDFHETHDGRRTELGHLLARTKNARERLAMKLERGRDRLLEMNSFRPAPAQAIAEAIGALDQETRLEVFLLRVWDHYGVPVEDLGPRAYKVGADGVYTDSFPGMPPGGMMATLDRRHALSREDVAFLSWDHPLVTGALDLLLGSRDGSTACVTWPEAPERGLWLEVVHLLECPAPAKLHADRFLGPTPLRVVVDTRSRLVPSESLEALDQAETEDLRVHELLENSQFHAILDGMVGVAQAHAEAAARPVIAAATARMEQVLGAEIDRLKALAAVNPNVRAEEVRATEAQRSELKDQLARARLRVDAVRVIMLGEAF
jgi:ATP-dependent helicase HepA